MTEIKTMNNEFDYYVIYPKSPADKHIATVDECPGPSKYIQDNFWEFHGKPVPNPQPTSFTYSAPVPRGKLTVGDYFWAVGDSVFSKRVIEVLTPMNIGGVQIIPATVFSNKGERYEDFFYLHIWRHIEAMDKEKSDFKYKYERYSIDRFVLDRKALAKIPLEERLIFKTREDRESLFHRSIVEAIMDTDPVGVVFEHCETKETYRHKEKAKDSAPQPPAPATEKPQPPATTVREIPTIQPSTHKINAAELVNSKQYKANTNGAFCVILDDILTPEAADYIRETQNISDRAAHETEEVGLLQKFIDYLQDADDLDEAFYCFATSDTTTINFACMETGKDDTLLVLSVNVLEKRCMVAFSPHTHGFETRTGTIEFGISGKYSIAELCQFAEVFMDDAGKEVPFPGVSNPAETSPQKLLNQRYFPDAAMCSVDEMMSNIMDSERDEEEEISNFRDYYQDEYPDYVITTDGKKITLTFCHLNEENEIEGETSCCIIHPNSRTIELISPDEESYSFKVSKKCIDDIRNHSHSWKGERFFNSIPFPEAAKAKKS